MHQKHSNIQRANYGNFARNEISVLGAPCSEIKIFFDKIINHFPVKKFAVVEADHKAEEIIQPYTKYTDKINFQRIDTQYNSNTFENRANFENTDLVMVNGNHFEAKKQIIFIDSRKSLEKKLEKLNNVALIILVEREIPQFLISHFEGNLPKVLKYEDENEIFDFFKNLMESSIAPLYGLVLVGGKSTRMGSDKASLKYHGQVQSEFVFEMLKNVCGDRVYLSVNDQQSYLENFPTITDRFLGIGPMGGILSAFQKKPDVAWFIVACDMPFLSENTINQLVTNRNPSKFATAFKSPHDDFPEPLITIWEPRAYPKLLQMLAYGYDCPRKTLINTDIELLEAKLSIELQNVNTQAEFEKAIFDLSPKFV